MEKLSYALKCSLVPDFMLNLPGVIAWNCTEISPAEMLSNFMVVGIVSNDSPFNDRHFNLKPSCMSMALSPR